MPWVSEGNGDLVERYLQAVRFLLPKEQQDDVDRELSEEVRSQIEEKQAALGRPLDRAELGSILKGFGHPVLLGLRYLPARSLIGPAVFPLYWLALRAILGLLAVVHLVLPAVYLTVTGNPAGIVPVFLRFPGVAIPAFAWITLAFAALDTTVVRAAVEKALSAWSPESLPQVAKGHTETRVTPGGLALTAALTVWWLVGLKFPTVILGPGAPYVGFGPGFQRLYVPMVVAAAATLGLSGLRLSGVKNPRLLRTYSLATDALNLVVLYLIFRGSDWFVAGPALAEVAGAQGLIALANLGTSFGLGIALVISGGKFAWEHLLRRRFPWVAAG